MPAITDGKENFKEGTQISRRNVLIGGAATLAAAALPAPRLRLQPPPRRKGENP